MLYLFGTRALSLEIQVILALAVTISWPVVHAIVVQIHAEKLLPQLQPVSFSLAGAQIAPSLGLLQSLPEHVQISISDCVANTSAPEQPCSAIRLAESQPVPPQAPLAFSLGYSPSPARPEQELHSVCHAAAPG